VEEERASAETVIQALAPHGLFVVVATENTVRVASIEVTGGLR
jgi:hypothetical protein